MNRITLALLMLVSLAGPISGCSSSSDSGSTSSKSAEKNGSGADNNKGTPGAQNTIEVTSDQQRVAGIRVAAIEPRSVPATLSVPGQITVDEQRTAHIAPYSDGKIADVLKNAGDVVQRGTVLAHLHSHSVHETVGALAQDFANVKRQEAAVLYAQQKRDRYAHLFSIQAASLEQQQGSEQELLQAKTDLSNAQAAVTMEREHLGDLLALPPESINQGNLYAHELVPIISPISGTVINRNVTPGMVLEPGNEAFMVSNLSEVWMIASVNETSLSRLRVSQHITVRSDAWPGQNFPGTITLIGASLDPATRTVQVRATLASPHAQLKPQMFVTATIDEAETRAALFVPEDALQEVNGVQVVFVTADGTHFVPRALKTRPPVNGQVEVTEGLHPGDRIAVAGAFMLKSDLLKGATGEE